MSEYWWRAYDAAVDHPKLCLLSDRAHRGWFNLLCVAAANDGVLPAMEVLTVKLRLPRKKIETIIAELVNRALLDEVDGTLRPHNWDRRQFKSDVTDPTAAQRMQRYRNKHRNADRNERNEPVTVTPPILQTTETEKKDTSLRSVVRSATPTRPTQSEEQFEEFWKAYPKRDGANPKGPSRKAFFSFIKAGIDPGAIIAGARRCAEADRAKIGTEYIPQAIKWLRDRRWEDYPEVAEQQPENTFGWQPGMPTDAELRAKHGSENGSGKGEGIRPASNGIHREPTENSEPGTEGGNLSGHKTGNSGVGSVGKILQRIPRF